MRAPRIRRYVPRPLGPDGLRHRIVMAGVYRCGVVERNGEVGTMRNKLVTCPKCRGLTAARQAEAKARAAR